MITIIHGDDLAQSRNFFNSLKSKSLSSVQFSEDTLTLTDLAQVLDGGGLFGQSKTIFIEGLYARRKSSGEFEALTEYLVSKSLDAEIVIWEDRELDKKSLGVFRHASVKTYKLSQFLFLFLDSIKPDDPQNLIQGFHKLLSSIDAEMIFFMLIRQVRLLLALSEAAPGERDQISEIKRLAPWQKSKLEKQAKLFRKSQLVLLHTRLFKIDKDIKTGKLSVPLTVALDILFLDI